MALQGITFDNQTVAAKDHGALFAGILDDGVVSGCALSFSGSTLTIAPGYLIACGRLIRNTASQSVTVTGSSGYSQVILTVDVSGGGSFSFSSVNANTPSFPALTQEDINDGVSTTYQMQICVLAMGAAGITAINEDFATAQPVIGDGTISASKLGSILPANVGVKMGTATPTTATLAEGEIYLKYS